MASQVTGRPGLPWPREPSRGRLRRGDVLNVQRAAREARTAAMSRAICELLACSWPAEHAEARGDDALVDLAVADKAVVLAVRHENLAEHACRNPWRDASCRRPARRLPSSVKATAPSATMSPISAMISPFRPWVHGARRVHAALANLGSDGSSRIR